MYVSTLINFCLSPFIYPAKLIEEEGMESGMVSMATYRSYSHYAGGWCSIIATAFFIVLANTLLVATNAWLAVWLRVANKQDMVR